ncbi:MAG TPA: hypothetical protein V6D35_12205 [Candidatus Sericytochromatia bacterium]
MSQKFFVSGWDELSPVQKTLVEEWIRGALRAKAAREALIKSYCDLNFSESGSYIENFSSEPSFEVFGSQSTLEERIELSSMSVESPPDLPNLSDCRAKCRNESNEQQCLDKCREKFI